MMMLNQAKIWIFGAAIALALCVPVSAQSPFLSYDDPIPAEVEQMYRRGLKYLAEGQSVEGVWEDNQGRDPGVVGLAVLAFLAHGEDPVTGPYASVIQRGIAYIIGKQNPSSGYISLSGNGQSSMYGHGFATLALAEAYGTVENPKIGKALEKALKLLISSQANNPNGAWRYSSSTTSADTTVSGACMVALLAGRNAGMEIPDTAIKRALNYYRTCQSPDGGFSYTASGGSGQVTSTIGALVFSLARKRDTTAFKQALEYLKINTDSSADYYRYYYLYYAAQAYFHADPGSDSALWTVWNTNNIRYLKSQQNSDGSWSSSYGNAFSTSAALLSLALNYRYLPIYER